MIRTLVFYLLNQLKMGVLPDHLFYDIYPQ